MPPAMQMMSEKFVKAVVCLCGTVGTAVPLAASPVQRADVAAEPTWVLHVDFDGLRPTAIGQYLLAEMEKPEAQAKLAALQTIFNFDLRKQLHGVTLYNAGKRSEDGVLLVYADVEPDRLVTLAKGAKGYQATTHKTHVIHSWVDENRKGKEGVAPRLYAGIHGGRVVVFGQQAPRVAQALDVMDRATASLAGSTLFAQLGARNSSGFIQAAARTLELPEGNPNMAMLRLAKAVRLELGEAQGKLKATLNLEASDADVARQMVAVGQGLLALMKLQTNNLGSVKLAEALALKQEGAGVEATVALSTSEAIALMKANAARNAEKNAAGE